MTQEGELRHSRALRFLHLSLRRSDSGFKACPIRVEAICTGYECFQVDIVRLKGYGPLGQYDTCFSTQSQRVCQCHQR